MKIKKITSLAAASVLVLAMSTTVFAGNPVTSAGGSDTADVKGTYLAGSSGAVVYSVDISWDEMSFTYTDASQGTWDPGSHQYTGASEASWSESRNIIVTNHSNASVKATAAFQANSGYETVSITFGGNNGEAIATAVGTEVGKAPSATITVIPGGSLPENTNGKIGEITVTIADAT